MTKTAKDYKVTFPYGSTSPPYSKANPHLGDDRRMDIGTDIVVNGVKIGESGNSGFSTGPHLHTGKWKFGTSYDPKGGGFTFRNPVMVTEVDRVDDNANGKFVRYQDASGYSWVQLHMFNPTVKVGDVLRVKKPLPIPILRKFHTIKRGETVDSISRKYKLPTKSNYLAFRKLNPGIRNINWVYPGQKVRVK